MEKESINIRMATRNLSYEFRYDGDYIDDKK